MTRLIAFLVLFPAPLIAQSPPCLPTSQQIIDNHQRPMITPVLIVQDGLLRRADANRYLRDTQNSQNPMDHYNRAAISVQLALQQPSAGRIPLRQYLPNVVASLAPELSLEETLWRYLMAPPGTEQLAYRRYYGHWLQLAVEASSCQP